MWRKLAFFMVMACALPLAHAEFYGFDCIGATSPNCPAGPTLSTQLFVQAQAGPGANQVKFTFYNIGPAASSIADVYFDDGTLLGIAQIIDGPGVDFEQGASPGNLPGGNPLGFQATAGFTADSEPPVQPNGVNPGEQLEVIFNLINGKTFTDTIAALNGGVDLKIGIHVQGFADGGSESFINTPVVQPNPFQTTPIPEPTSVVLLGTTLLGVCHVLRKRFAA